MREAPRRVRQYEMMIIIVPDLPEEDLPGAIDRVSGIIAGANGTVTHISRESPWGRRRLAYPIRHESRDVRDGFYVLYYFDADAGAIDEIEREIKLFNSVMRHMITHQVQAPVMPEETPEAVEGGEAATAEVDTGEAPESADGVEAGTPSGPDEAGAATEDAAPAETANDGETAAPAAAGAPATDD